MQRRASLAMRADTGSEDAAAVTVIQPRSVAFASRAFNSAVLPAPRSPVMSSV